MAVLTEKQLSESFSKAVQQRDEDAVAELLLQGADYVSYAEKDVKISQAITTALFSPEIDTPTKRAKEIAKILIKANPI